MTPGEAIHAFCAKCVGGSVYDIKNCGGDNCPGKGGVNPDGSCWLYRYRMGKGRPSVKMIRKYCLFCQGGSEKLVRECIEGPDVWGPGIDPCVFHPYRMGKNPNCNPNRAKNFLGKRDIGAN